MTQVMQAMNYECAKKDLNSFLRSTAAVEKVSDHRVCILELTGTNKLAQPELHDLAKRLKCSLILILLPKAKMYETTAWLDAGADRCLPVEIDIKLIQAMIRSMLNRCCGQFATYTEHGLLRFEHDTNTLFYRNVKVELTYKEALLTSLLLRNINRHIKRDELCQLLCADDKRNPDSAVVYLYIHRLNKKLRSYGLQIAHKRGYGYQLHEDLTDRSGVAFDCSSSERKLGNHLFGREIVHQTWFRI